MNMMNKYGLYIKVMIVFKSLSMIIRVYVSVCVCLSGRLLFWNAALNRMNLLENCLGLFSLDWLKIQTS